MHTGICSQKDMADRPPRLASISYTVWIPETMDLFVSVYAEHCVRPAAFEKNVFTICHTLTALDLCIFTIFVFSCNKDV